jgi:hypothetical protein
MSTHTERYHLVLGAGSRVVGADTLAQGTGRWWVSLSLARASWQARTEGVPRNAVARRPLWTRIEVTWSIEVTPAPRPGVVDPSPPVGHATDHLVDLLLERFCLRLGRRRLIHGADDADGSGPSNAEQSDARDGESAARRSSHPAAAVRFMLVACRSIPPVWHFLPFI